MDIAKIVLESVAMSDSKTRQNKTAMAEQLLLAVMKINEDTKKVEKTVLDDSDLARQLQVLREAEASGNIAWMDANSWKCIEKSQRKVWEEILDPLVLSCVYFDFRKFIDRKLEILQNMKNLYVSVLKDGSGKHLIIMNSRQCTFQSLKEEEVRYLHQQFNKRLLTTYGISKQVFMERVFNDGARSV